MRFMKRRRSPDRRGRFRRSTRKRTRIIERVQKSGRTLLTEPESKELLAAYGIPVVPTVIATSETEAVDKAAQFDGPVVLKIYSHTITHKTDVGGVKLNLIGEAAVRAAYREIEEAVRDARSASGQIFSASSCSR